MALEAVEGFPATDVRENVSERKMANRELLENVSARWIDMDSDSERYDDIRCSNCGHIYTVDAYHWCDIGFIKDDLKYCPNCGADMQKPKGTEG